MKPPYRKNPETQQPIRGAEITLPSSESGRNNIIVLPFTTHPTGLVRTCIDCDLPFVGSTRSGTIRDGRELFCGECGTPPNPGGI